MAGNYYAERMRSYVSSAPAWQVTPLPAEHIRELLSEPGGLAATAGSHPGFTDHGGGSSIKHPRLVLIDCGPWWGDTAKRNRFAKELMTYGYLSKLANYGSGNGSFWGVVNGPTFTGNITDADIQHAITTLISVDALPKPDGSTIYAVCLPDGVNVIDPQTGQPGNCNQYCGYHSAIDSNGKYYAVLPSALCDPCHGAQEPFQAFTMVLAHEVAEACTDAVPGQGWFVDDPNDPMNGAENADLEAWIPLQWGPWVVQGYYTREEGNTLGAYNPVATATRLLPVTPPDVQVGVPVSFSVTAVDDSNTVVPSFSGLVTFECSDPSAAVPASYRYNTRDRGSHSFSIIFRTAGTQTVTISSQNGVSLSAQMAVSVGAVDYSRLYPLFDWEAANYGSKLLDLLEKLDPNPQHVLVFEEWRAAGHDWGFW